MDLGDYDYDLPDALIARYPPAERSASRMLVVPSAGDAFQDKRFTDLPALLTPGDVLVVNDTAVIPARLRGTKDTGGKVELLLERASSDDTARVHIRASKSPRAGTVLHFAAGIEARVVGRSGEYYDVAFNRPVATALAAAGEVPLPPYLGRDAESADTERYQTVYASAAGAVAAPTAGLHFDAAVFAALAERGVDVVRITLHVGAGTFQNLRPEQIDSGRLHAERVIVTAEAAERINAARERGHRIVAVGTTAVRSLETAWHDGALAPVDTDTELFIQPGYRFRAVDAMLTNFHLPRSSLLLLVSAFSGRDRILAAYAHAVDARYRFFSYGDCMLLTAPNAGAAT